MSLYRSVAATVRRSYVVTRNTAGHVFASLRTTNNSSGWCTK